MTQRIRVAVMFASVVVITSASLSEGRVFSYIPNVPWSMERINAPVGREFMIYCQLTDFWANLAFKQAQIKKCTFYAVKNKIRWDATNTARDGGIAIGSSEA